MRHLSDRVFLLILSVVVGGLSGLAAVLLKTLVHVTNRWLLEFNIPTFVGGNLLILIYPAIGILLTILFVRYIVKGQIGHGLPSVLLSLSRKGGVLPARNMYSSLVASTLTVAFGGSVGLEAPIASTGSAIGSNIGRFFRLSAHDVKLLLGCGAAGAIAGIFKAPIAGVLFVIEVFMFDMTATSILPLMLSAVSASTVAYFLMGNELQFAFNVVGETGLSQIPYYIVLGVFCAAVSLYFLRITDRVEEWFSRRRSQTHRAVIGAVALGVMIFLFPPLFGEGYAFLTELLNGSDRMLFEHSIFSSLSENNWMVLAYLLVLILMKAVATATTIGCGGVGGTFGPSLIVGGMSGYFICMLSNQLGFPEQSTANFALVGMAAVMTGVMHAPFMAIFLIAEITGGYALMVPLLVASSVTYLCVSPFERHSIYARKLAEQGDLLTHDKDTSAWQLMDMRKLIETNFVVVREEDKLRELVEAIKYSKRNIFPVLSDDDKFMGVILLDDVRHIIFQPELYDTTAVVDLMHPLSEGDIVRISDPPADVVNKFQVGNRYNLIVIDDDGFYLGFLSRANTFSAYRRFVSSISEE
ncbi:MAG: chloride channel protein [Bacteroidales bacterium]|jgi:CIC family chloride channel protein|nr:chloride channel protein [Bacteroidales bacterium]